jgi:hypothetical protein
METIVRSKTGLSCRRFIAALVIGLLVIAWPGRVQANGGTTMLVEQIDGYEVTVTGSPYPLEVGRTNDVSVLLGRLSDEGVELDAEVMITTEPLDQPGLPQTFAATHANASNKLYYASFIDFPNPGRWRLTIQVAGPDGSGSATFEETVGERQIFDLLIYPLIGIAAIVILYFFAVGLGRRSNESGKNEETHGLNI